MADFVLSLGGVEFQSFEIPEDIKAGGAQALFIHKYPGGARTIDTTGPDDDDIPWSGWFEGPTALDRCQQLDTMRRQGQAVTLAWSGYQFSVVIREFKWKFQRYYHIAYSIALAVVQDLNNPVPQASQDVDSQITSDANDATNDAATLNETTGDAVADGNAPA
jgi:hypothetical protein